MAELEAMVFLPGARCVRQQEFSASDFGHLLGAGLPFGGAM
jgi:hypothetical protein